MIFASRRKYPEPLVMNGTSEEGREGAVALVYECSLPCTSDGMVSITAVVQTIVGYTERARHGCGSDAGWSVCGARRGA